jgi:hypothetical protein
MHARQDIYETKQKQTKQTKERASTTLRKLTKSVGLIISSSNVTCSRRNITEKLLI